MYLTIFKRLAKKYVYCNAHENTTNCQRYNSKEKASATV